MDDGPAKLRFLTDNNVPDSLGAWLAERGHEVRRVRDHMPNDSADPVVAVAAVDAGLILVSQDKDFNAQRFAQAKFARLKPRDNQDESGATIKMRVPVRPRAERRA